MRKRIAILERKLERSLRTQRRLEDVREKNDKFLQRTILDQQEAEALLRQRKEAVETTNAELRRAQERLIASERSANEANQAKSSFLANMSHELRTPLTAIIGYSEFLIEEGLEDRVQSLDDLGRVLLSARHLLSMVNDVLDVSKIEAGHYDVALDTFDLCALIDEMLDASRVLVEKRQNRLLWTRPEPIMIYSDAKAVRQCLFNLVSNAAKFTRDGTVKVVCTTSDSGSVDVLIQDTGIGMAKDRLETIFDEFTQARSNTGTGGTGLGLAITRKLLAMLNGAIVVESSLGVGSSFLVTLPLRCFEHRTQRTSQAGARSV